MPARKISFRISGDTARAVERLATDSHLHASDIASDALDFQVILSASASDYHAIQNIRRHGGEGDLGRLTDRVSRVIQHTSRRAPGDSDCLVTR